MNVSEHEFWEIGMSTPSETNKYLNAYNFFNLYHNSYRYVAIFF